MPSALWTRIVIGLSAALWFALAWALDAPLNATWLKPAGFVSSAVVLLLLAFDLLVWRWLPMAVTKRPNIRGTWAADLHYTWPPDTPPRTKRCYLVVRQTFSAVSVRMHFDTSASRSRCADIREQDGDFNFWWVYQSEATEFDRDNPAHRGAADVVVATVPNRTLDGIYWTERKTTGRLVTTEWSKRLYDSYAAAHKGSFRDRR